MSAFVHAPGFPFLIEFPPDDVREVSPLIREMVQDNHCVLFNLEQEGNDVPTQLLINFGQLKYLLVTANAPDDGQQRRRLETSLAAVQRV